MNKRYLSHDYLTDIITFDYSESGHIAGDLFISVDTVKSNSDFFKVLFEEELWRVLIHGVLHLCGLNDKSESDQMLMRNTEDVFLSRLDNPFVSRET
jgi:rRNA maturation RNase YbeY